MPLITTRSPRRQQPQGAARIDRSNPLTDGLVLAYSASSPVARQMLPSTNTVSPVPGPRGLAHAAGVRKWDTGPLLPTARSTVVAVLSAALPSWTQVYPFGHGEPWGTYMMMSVYHDGSQYYGGWASGSTASLDYVLGITVADLQSPRVYSVRNVGSGATDLHFHLDGRQTGSGGGSGGVSAITAAGAASGAGWVSGSGADGSHSGMRLYGVWVWDRALSDAELALVHANPWRVFAQQSRRIWLPEAAAGGVPDITALYAESIGSDRVSYHTTLNYA